MNIDRLKFIHIVIDYLLIKHFLSLLIMINLTLITYNISLVFLKLK